MFQYLAAENQCKDSSDYLKITMNHFASESKIKIKSKSKYLGKPLSKRKKLRDKGGNMSILNCFHQQVSENTNSTDLQEYSGVFLLNLKIGLKQINYAQRIRSSWNWGI